jgi:signal transduction histidine kinase
MTSLPNTTGGVPAIRPRRFRSLASRMVAVGVLQLALLAATALAIFFLEGPRGPVTPEDHVDPRKLELLADEPGAIQQALAELREKRVQVSIYNSQRQLIASNVDPPLAVPLRWRPRGPGGLGGRGDGGGPGGPPPGDDGRSPPPGDERSGPPPGIDGRSGPPPGDDRPPPRGNDRTSPPGDDGRRPPPGEDRPPPSGNDRTSPPGDNDRGAPPGQDRPPPPESERRPPPGDDGRGAPPDQDRPPPPEGRGPPPGGRPRLGTNRPMLTPFHVDGDRGVLIARGAPAKPPSWAGPVITLVCGLLILVFGAVVTARWIVRPIDRLARAARALGRGDLAARSRLERTDEIGELGHRFDEMADRIENLMRSEKELFANVAHELRTPLARIGVALDLAGEGDAEAARASLAEIAVDVTELETIVDDILSAMRFEIASGKGAVAQLPLRKAHVAPDSIVAAAVERQRSRHRDRTIEVTVAPSLPMLDVDPMLVRRVLDNLLENAHKYTPDTARPTAISARRDGDRVVFEVVDRGIGIGIDDLPHVFTAFFRGERSRSRETGGVGLGLTLAKRIVEAHDGTIEAESAAAAGTTMRVSLPAAS